MVEAAPMRVDEQAGQWVAVALLAGMFILFLLQLPQVLGHHSKFSPWLYVPGLLAMFVALWKRADHLAWLSIFWLSTYFMIDVYYGVSLF